MNRLGLAQPTVKSFLPPTEEASSEVLENQIEDAKRRNQELLDEIARLEKIKESTSSTEKKEEVKENGKTN